MSFPVCREEIIAPEARKERSCQSFSASHIGPRADCPFHRPAFFRPGTNHEVTALAMRAEVEVNIIRETLEIETYTIVDLLVPFV